MDVCWDRTLATLELLFVATIRKIVCDPRFVSSEVSVRDAGCENGVGAVVCGWSRALLSAATCASAKFVAGVWRWEWR